MARARTAALDFPQDDVRPDTEQNSNYLCRITANDLGFASSADNTGSGTTPTILLKLPEQFQFSVASAFEAPFAQGLIQSEGIKNFSKFMGFSNLVTQSLTAQVWQGTQEVDFSLTFELVAENDPDTDVVQPIKRLMMLTLPDVGPIGLLTPPGPVIDFARSAESLRQSATSIGASALSSITGRGATDITPAKVYYKNDISLEIGRFLKFPSVVVRNVSFNGKMMFHKSGLPISASVDVSFGTFVVPTKNDVDGMFPTSRKTRASTKAAS